MERHIERGASKRAFDPKRSERAYLVLREWSEGEIQLHLALRAASEARGDVMSRYRCPVCGYVYDETVGDPREGFPPGTPWDEVPDDWACPACGVRDKVDFEPEGP